MINHYDVYQKLPQMEKAFTRRKTISEVPIYALNTLYAQCILYIHTIHITIQYKYHVL